MPIYKYSCQKCGNNFELLVRSSTKLECPQCKDQGIQKQLTTFGITTKGNPPACTPADCKSCEQVEMPSSPCGGGGCGMRR